MQGDRNLVAEATDYAGQTQARISWLAGELNGLRQGNQKDIHCLISHLEDQADSSHKAQFSGIARLAMDMTNCLRLASGGKRGLDAGTVDALLDACQCIILHAEAVAAGAYSRGTGLVSAPQADRSEVHRQQRLPTSPTSAN